MGFSLNDIKTAVLPSPDIIFLYGVHGIGKTTFAAQFPSPLFLLTENSGFDKLGISPSHLPQFSRWLDLVDSLNGLVSTPHQFKTIVLDTIDGAVDLAEQHIIQSERSFAGLRSEYENYGRGYKFLAAVMKEIFIPAIQSLRNKGITVVLLGHSQVTTFQNPEGKDWDRYQPKLPDGAKTSINKVLSEKVDLVLFANMQVVVNAEGKGSGNRRVLHTTNSPAWEAKQRHGLPTTIEFSYQAFADAMNSAQKNRVTTQTPVQYPVSQQAPQAVQTEKISELDKISQMINGQESAYNEYLKAIRWIKPDMTYRNLSAEQIGGILRKPEAFKAAVQKFEREKTAKGVVS